MEASYSHSQPKSIIIMIQLHSNQFIYIHLRPSNACLSSVGDRSSTASPRTARTSHKKQKENKNCIFSNVKKPKHLLSWVSGGYGTNQNTWLPQGTSQFHLVFV